MIWECMECGRRFGSRDSHLWRLRCPHCQARLLVKLPWKTRIREAGWTLAQWAFASVVAAVVVIIVILLALLERR